MAKDPGTPAPDPAPMTEKPAASMDAPPEADDPLHVDPSEEEVEAWVARERERRRAWLEGPSDAEQAAWVRRERMRRLAGLGPEARATELARLGRHYGRESQLVAEGAMSLFWAWSRRALAQLARAGLEWEQEDTRSPRRRRVTLDDEER